jgi:cell fate regulator YaaT (PSP1 superfamily)
MATTVEVRFKGNRKDYYLWPDEADPLHLHQPVIVEADRGLDFGRVGVRGEAAEAKCAAGCSGCAVGSNPPTASLRVIREATGEDIKAHNDLRRSEDETRIKAVERVRHFELDMKLSDAEWQWDRKKLTFYFTADKRVDFRNLVRDLASTFKARIELRQIGARDEAARLGGVGRCGKGYCCSTWLRELSPVSLSLAKDQRLSLNPAQISGGCGRLLCCLKYEHEFYAAARKRFPKEGKLIRTGLGSEKVLAVDIFRERVTLRGEEGPRTVLLADLKAEMDAAGPGSVATAPRAEPATAPDPTDPRREKRLRPDRHPAPPPEAESQTPPAPPEQPPAAAEAGDAPADRKRSRKRRRRRRGRRGGPDSSPNPDS